MPPKSGSRMPKQPGSESEQLIYYRAIHFLRESARDEDDANDALIAVYRRQCEFIAEIRPFASWEEVAHILGSTAVIMRNRFRTYSNTAVKELLGDEPE